MPNTPNSDRALTTLAILKVNQEEGLRHLESFTPFVLHCLSHSGVAQISTSPLRAAIQTEFDIELPQAVLKRILNSVTATGKVRLENGIYMADLSRLGENDLSPLITEVGRRRGELIDALRTFAHEEFTVSWTRDETSDHLHAYIESFSSRVLAASITGEQLPRDPSVESGDQYVVHRFADRLCSGDHTLFEHLLTLVKGRMLGDGLHYLSDRGDEPPSLDKVEVYLDGPPLLFVLGYAGPELQGPYCELLELLSNQVAIVRTFEHCVTEAREILDAASGKARAGGPTQQFHGDVVAHLVQTGRSPTDIALLAERLPNDLLKHGINPVETPRRSERLQPDEERLAGELQKRLNYGNRLARDRDIDSLTAIGRLREGRSFRDLEKCRALFVTHNFNLFRTSTYFFRTADPLAVPPAAYDMSLATMLWLREPSPEPNLPRERVISQSYAALNPDDRLWKAYNAEIEKLRSEGHLEEDDAQFLRYGREATEALMDVTRGDHEAFTEGTLDQVLARARENVLAETRRELKTAESRTDRAEMRLRFSAGRISSLASGVGAAIATLVFVVVLAPLVVGTVFGPVGPADPLVSGPVQAACAAIAGGMAVITMVFSPSLLQYRRRFAHLLSGGLERFLYGLLGLDDDARIRDDDSPSGS